MDKLLRCTISPGQFSDEYAVTGTLFDNTEFSLFAERDDLQFEGEPTEDHPIEGYIRITPGPKKNDLFLVTLPRPTLENGRSITVTADQIL